MVNRTFCETLEAMRKCDKNKSYGNLTSMVEEAEMHSLNMLGGVIRNYKLLEKEEYEERKKKADGVVKVCLSSVDDISSRTNGGTMKELVKNMIEVVSELKLKTYQGDFGAVAGLIERWQDVGNRLESALYAYKDVEYAEEKCKERKKLKSKLKKEIEELESRKLELELELKSEELKSEKLDSEHVEDRKKRLEVNDDNFGDLLVESARQAVEHVKNENELNDAYVANKYTFKVEKDRYAPSIFTATCGEFPDMEVSAGSYDSAYESIRLEVLNRIKSK